jgi:hypothetical protein
VSRLDKISDLEMSEYYKWENIVDIPEKPGIYAWYFSPDLTNYDIEKLINDLRGETKDGQARRELVIKFLNKNIFSYYSNLPYMVIIEGSLKPTYKGQLEQATQPSVDLIDRILERPQRLKSLQNILAGLHPMFGNPIYVGKSSNLNIRIKEHKKQIQRYKNRGLYDRYPENEEAEKNTFASEICKRNLPVARLVVATHVVEYSDCEYTDIENILNRMYYPIFGRN